MFLGVSVSVFPVTFMASTQVESQNKIRMQMSTVPSAYMPTISAVGECRFPPSPIYHTILTEKGHKSQAVSIASQVHFTQQHPKKGKLSNAYISSSPFICQQRLMAAFSFLLPQCQPTASSSQREPQLVLVWLSAIGRLLFRK